MTAAAGVACPVCRRQGTSIPRPVDGPHRGEGGRPVRIVCLPERDGRDSDLSCVPNEKRPLSAGRRRASATARYLVRIQRCVHLQAAERPTAVACSVGGLVGYYRARQSKLKL